MEEIAIFVEIASIESPSTTKTDASTTSPREMAAIYRGMAATFERVSLDIEKGDSGEDVATLSDWSKKGKERLLQVGDQSTKKA